MKKHSYPMANVGSVSLLMTFIILCLAVFATLALSGAVKEYQYSVSLAEYKQDYYKASNSATELLREIDEILHTAFQNCSDTASSDTDFSDMYYESVQKQLSLLQDVEVDFTGEEPLIAYEVFVNDSQKLRVVLALTPIEEAGRRYEASNSLKDQDQTQVSGSEGYYRITAWQKLPSAQWKADNQMNLINLD